MPNETSLQVFFDVLVLELLFHVREWYGVQEMNGGVFGMSQTLRSHS